MQRKWINLSFFTLSYYEAVINGFIVHLLAINADKDIWVKKIAIWLKSFHHADLAIKLYFSETEMVYFVDIYNNIPLYYSYIIIHIHI